MAILEDSVNSQYFVREFVDLNCQSNLRLDSVAAAVFADAAFGSLQKGLDSTNSFVLDAQIDDGDAAVD